MRCNGLYVLKVQSIWSILSGRMSIPDTTDRELWTISIHGTSIMFWGWSVLRCLCGCIVIEIDCLFMRRCMCVMFLSSKKDRVLKYVIIIMTYCPSWTPLHWSRSDHETIMYMHSNLIIFLMLSGIHGVGDVLKGHQYLKICSINLVEKWIVQLRKKL